MSRLIPVPELESDFVPIVIIVAISRWFAFDDYDIWRAMYPVCTLCGPAGDVYFISNRIDEGDNHIFCSEHGLLCRGSGHEHAVRDDSIGLDGGIRFLSKGQP